MALDRRAFLEHGYLVTTAEELIGADKWAELQAAVADLKTRPRVEKDVQWSGVNKSYLNRWLGVRPTHDPSSIYARIALETPIYELARWYLRDPRLVHYNIWQVEPSHAPPQASQVWHKDGDDAVMLKAFLYLTDVDAGAGPLWMIPGTHGRGELQGFYAPFTWEVTETVKVRRTSDAQMARVIRPERWVELTGKTGTVILMDTRGYHKGGHATTTERWVYMCHFVTPKASKRSVRLDGM